jgi:hypothetical protein
LARFRRDWLAVFQPICNHAKSQRFGSGPSFLGRRSVSDNARQSRNFADPPSIVFALNFNPHGECPLFN